MPEPNLLGFHQKLNHLGEGKYPIPAHSSHPVLGKEVEVGVGNEKYLESSLKDRGTIGNAFPPPTPYHYIIKDLLVAVPLLSTPYMAIKKK